jgi:hypothetical protein
MHTMIKLPEGMLDHIEAVERLAPNGGLAEKKGCVAQALPGHHEEAHPRDHTQRERQ